MARVVPFEIHADEPERAAGFYEKCFSWSFQKWEGGPIAYWLVTTGPSEKPGINGGMLKRMYANDGNAVLAYVCTLEVENVDESSAAVLANGGQVVVPKMPVPGVGWLMYCKDTEGNIFGLMHPDPSAQ